MQRILVTGAAGKIGRTLRDGLRNCYGLVRLSDIRPMAAAGPGEECVMADLTDGSALREITTSMDCIVHLGGIPTEASWQDVIDANIIGTANLFEAARLSGVKRVVYASSNHVIGFYRNELTVGTADPVRPDSRYGISKAFGEAVGRMYADKHGMSVACLRIGSFRERPQSSRELATWISPRDLVHLVRRCIDAPNYRYITLYGVSANRRCRWSGNAAEFVGYHPQDDGDMFAADFPSPSPADTPEHMFHGGRLAGLEFTNDPDSIE
jgi:uronate dehydrogenase